MRRLFSLLLVLTILVPISMTATTQIQAQSMTPGTYTASAPGMKGPVTVEVKVDESKIIQVSVMDNVDTPVIADAAINDLPERIVAKQNVEVDVTSGATLTSFGIRNAVINALEKAGADLNSFKKGSDAISERVSGQAQSYDIVIVGSGISGLTASITIKRSNPDLSVLVLEKEAYTGGSSRVCGGGIWVLGSEINNKIDSHGTLEQLIDFMKMRSETDALNLDLMASIYAASDDTFAYLYEHGLPVALEGSSLGHPDSHLPVLWASNHGDYPWETGNSGIMDVVQKNAEDLGVEIRLNSKVTTLSVDEKNAVKGVEVEDSTSTYNIDAQKVILATGGFTRNTELIDKYAPNYKNAFAFTGAGNTGDGITLTQDLDTVIVGEGMMGLYGVNPNFGYYGSTGNLVWHRQLAVNAEGKAFGLETAFYADTLKLLLDQTGSCAYGIFDSTSAVQDRLEQALSEGVAQKFDTLDALASVMKIELENLKVTAQEKNLAEGPYYCIILRPLFIGSIPGLKVDENCRVLTNNESVIQNLYACGELIFGNVFSKQYASSGTGIAVSTYTGAIAGKTATEDIK